MTEKPIPPNASACLMLADGTMFFGESIGAGIMTAGEICFNTAMTGYQEILTDPSYTGQIITFTFPHIGNSGCNEEDRESSEFKVQSSGSTSLPNSELRTPNSRLGACGIILRERPTLPSNFRSNISLQDWLVKNNISGICGVDTRALTKHIRKNGAQNGVIFRVRSSEFGVQWKEAKANLLACPNMNGLDLAKSVSAAKPYEWKETLWTLNSELRTPNSELYHVVAIDYGVKMNILRNLAERGCKISIVPATTSAEEILKLKPDGIFLSNGPGDPAATGMHAVAVIKKLVDSGVPIFGICLGHQLLGHALGGKTEKMQQGHRGANHPVKDLKTGKVIITSQNHGFAVSKEGLPSDVEITHISLFDGTVQGIRHKTKPIFAMQGHPEASPGPHDSGYLFNEFIAMIKEFRVQNSEFRKKSNG